MITNIRETLTDEEKDILISFNQNTKLKDLVKSFLTKGVTFEGAIKPSKNGENVENVDITRNFAFSTLGIDHTGNAVATNEEIGARLKMMWEAYGIINVAFSEIEKVVPIVKEKAETKKPRI